LVSDVKGGMFDNKVLRRIRVFGPKRDEVTGGWKKLHNENDQVKEDEMGRECNTNWGEDECI
jgi:hypothetical protein